MLNNSHLRSDWLRLTSLLARNLSGRTIQLFHTLLTLAADGSNVIIKVSLAIVDGDWFPCFDIPFSPDPYSSSRKVCYSIWPAGVVDITGEISSGLTVNSQLFTDLEQVSSRHLFLVVA